MFASNAERRREEVVRNLARIRSVAFWAFLAGTFAGTMIVNGIKDCTGGM